jgi:hypothetical protein
VKGTENIARPVNQYQSAFFAHIALQFKKLAKKLAKIQVALIATNGISITIAPVSKLLFGRNNYLAKIAIPPPQQIRKNNKGTSPCHRCQASTIPADAQAGHHHHCKPPATGL